jgi:hypothetical protein
MLRTIPEYVRAISFQYIPFEFKHIQSEQHGAVTTLQILLPGIMHKVAFRADLQSLSFAKSVFQNDVTVPSNKT